ncbi:MAG: carotenoid cleavage dioxygenase [Acidimicrobiales bacterium]|nr:carotenoid cleavage dioxygenase [Acidimicrobiales bacterium]
MNLSTGNRYLDGNFGPVREELTVDDLPVVGSMPEFLDGRYLRNGPNPVTDPDPAAYHWFTGAGMVHGLRIEAGRARWYRNRWVRSAAVARALGEQPRPGPVHAGFDFSPNTHVIGHAGRTLAIVEGGGNPYELTDELDTIGPNDFDGTLPGGYTAHPLRDPESGELHAISYYWGWGPKVQYTVVGRDGRVRRVVDIEVEGGPMMHSFSLTESHVVIYDLPVTFDVEGTAGLVPKAIAKPFTSIASRMAGRPTPKVIATRINRRASAVDTPFPYAWNPEHPARVGVMDRDDDTGAVRWFDVEPCYVYHPLNAYDDGERIVLDVVRHPKMFDTDRHGPNEGAPTFDRWTVDLTAGKVLEERLDDRGQEFPRVDERVVGRRHRYGYASGFEAGILNSGVVYKHDLVSGASEQRSFGAGHAADEFVFVPASGAAAEDDGVLMGFVYDVAADRSALEVLDAQTLESVATVALPTRVPHGFHGSWIPT